LKADYFLLMERRHGFLFVRKALIASRSACAPFLCEVQMRGLRQQRTLVPTLLLIVISKSVEAATPPAEGIHPAGAQSDSAVCTLTAAFAPLPSLAWPLVALTVFLLIAFNTRVGRLLGLIPKFVNKIRGPAGFEVQINADAAKEVRANFKASYKEFVDSAQDEYERMADAKRVGELLREVMMNALPEAMKQVGAVFQMDGVRATVHVEDIVFRSFLYQLVRYFPFASSGGKAGRRF
jgi:hypothetical protein